MMRALILSFVLLTGFSHAEPIPFGQERIDMHL